MTEFSDFWFEISTHDSYLKHIAVWKGLRYRNILKVTRFLPFIQYPVTFIGSFCRCLETRSNLWASNISFLCALILWLILTPTQSFLGKQMCRTNWFSIYFLLAKILKLLFLCCECKPFCCHIYFYTISTQKSYTNTRLCYVPDMDIAVLINESDNFILLGFFPKSIDTRSITNLKRTMRKVFLPLIAFSSGLCNK